MKNFHHSKTENRIFIVVLFFLITFLLFFFYNRGFIAYDEGWILYPARAILNGQIPYKDFHYIYTPGIIYVIALGFKIFGTNILVSRLFTMLFSLLSVFLLYKITSLITKKRLFILIPIFVYLAWGPMHINFAWPVIYAIFTGLLTCFFLIKTIDRNESKLLFFAGISVFLTIMFKQNFGLALLINSFVFFIFNSKFRNTKNVLIFSIGLLLPLIFVMFYFNYVGALKPFFNDMNYYLVQEILIKKHITTPFIYKDIWYKEILKTFLYLFPLLISLSGLIVLFKHNKKIIFLASFSMFYYLAGIRPQTDSTHLVPLLSLTGIPLVLILYYVNSKFKKRLIYVFSMLFILLGFYSAFFRNYYRWDIPIIKHDNKVNNTRVGVLVNDKYKIVIPEIDKYVEKYSKENKYIFIYQLSPLFYLTTNKINPTKFIYAAPLILPDQYQIEITDDIRKKNVEIIITDTDLINDTSRVSKFIRNNYKMIKKIEDYYIWQRKISFLIFH